MRSASEDNFRAIRAMRYSKCSSEHLPAPPVTSQLPCAASCCCAGGWRTTILPMCRAWLIWRSAAATAPMLCAMSGSGCSWLAARPAETRMREACRAGGDIKSTARRE